MQRIVCIGAGRLAHHLMPELEKAGCQVVQVINRTRSAAALLAGRLGATGYTDDLTKADPKADFYFFAISDDAIAQTAEHLMFLEDHHRVFLHGSGILALEALPQKRRGVFYPLQTFSPDHKVPWPTTPVLLTASDQEIYQTLEDIAGRISKVVYRISDEEKKVLHLGAVFANNFTNHLLNLAEKLCAAHEVPFEILKPIIRETFEKALMDGAAKSQSGPALRGDIHTLERHLKMLEGQPVLQDIYRMISNSINPALSGKW